MINYQINYESKNITFTNKAFVTRARKQNSKEFKEVSGLRKDFPDFEFVLEPKKGNHNVLTDGLTYDKMKEYIDSNMPIGEAQRLKDEMEQQRALHALDINPYNAIKAWFFEQFPEVEQQRKADNEAAKEKRRIAREAKEAAKR